ncbi:MAG: glycosyltransferase family 2 protein [Lachnospiraceae bacterium]|nr:glycosyltransferase family 2 protein [Lachnospiraceae bacterium]MDD7025793.1 glycosyltransferase family 2 protein [Lachnospiraceae bacterium]MDY5699972.1 glycosyltransferase family 2 protein [Lachnospiraceae bacterium]
MSASLKNTLKQILVNRQHRRYERKIKEGEVGYPECIEEKGIELLPVTKDRIQVGKMTFLHLEAKEVTDCGRIMDKQLADILLITFCPGKISEIALPLIYQKFMENEGILLIYGDEDGLENGQRSNPWFKPDWSPDTFLSGFYLGGLIAVRWEQLKKAYIRLMEKGESLQAGENVFYQLCFTLLQDNHAFEKGHEEKKLPICHIPRILYHRLGEVKQADIGFGPRLEKKVSEEGAEVYLSIIIPSKDNPEVLFQCLDSLLEITETAYSYEILIIDNGSSPENRERIQRKTGGMEEVKYFYEPMPFNFSRMCNLGAGKARGEVLLFLNDDMEIIQSDWLDLLVEKVGLPHVGAVGAKLLYPQSTIIQHAGITNLRVGPAHKLQFLDDRQEHYFGKNRGVHNMLAVTGACLMVRKQAFEEVGGFAEILAVAFNDVDLCYSLYEAGYYNVVRNDVVLYHHESLSRGNDGESVEKQMRLQKEKDILYERHQDLYGRDPFYHPRLATDILKSEYCYAFSSHIHTNMPLSAVCPMNQRVARSREDKCLVVGMECAMDIYKWRFGISYEKRRSEPAEEDKGYYFQGYSFVTGADNACYKKWLLLKNLDTGEILGIKAEGQYRPDIQKDLPDQENVGLTGFTMKIKRDQLKNGCYRFGILAQDTCSRLRLVNWSNWVLEVTGEGAIQQEA